MTLRDADGEEDLGAVVADTASDPFAPVDDLETELRSFLPVEAVGEAGQSEGEG